jgi:hypothetical protein
MLLAEILLPIALGVGLELGFRAYLRATPELGPPRIFNSSISSGKYVAFRRNATTRPRTDILFMGLSPMMGLSARHLVDFLGARGHAVTAFNFSFPFHEVDFDRLLLRDIVLDCQEAPRLVVYGVMPLNLLFQSAAAETEKRTRALPGFQFHEASFGARLRALAVSRLQLFLYRDLILDALVGTERPVDPWAKPARGFDEFGDLAPSLENRPPAGLKDREVARYKGPLQNFLGLVSSRPFGQSLRTLGAFCREHGTRLLLVNTAVSPFFLELLPHGRSDYDIFVRRMAAVAVANGVSFLDLSGPDLGAPEDFVDSHHLNHKAALRATEKIADFVLSRGLLD